MKKDLYRLTPEELGELFPIIIKPYNDQWPLWFEEEKKNLYLILGEKLALRIEHVGSTAVPGMTAKPTVDILVEISHDDQDKERIIQKMNEAGYLKMHEITNHIMYVKGYTPEGTKERTFHIHMESVDDRNFWNRIYFRDYLRLYPDAARRYENLKKKLALKYKNDRDGYTEAKTEFINKITRRALKKWGKMNYPG